MELPAFPEAACARINTCARPDTTTRECALVRAGSSLAPNVTPRSVWMSGSELLLTHANLVNLVRRGISRGRMATKWRHRHTLGRQCDGHWPCSQPPLTLRSAILCATVADTPPHPPPLAPRRTDTSIHSSGELSHRLYRWAHIVLRVSTMCSAARNRPPKHFLALHGESLG